MDQLLSGDNYKKTNKTRTGDVAVYRDANGVEHSMTVTKTDKKGRATEVSGLGELEPAAHSNPPKPGPGGGWEDPAAKVEYYTKPGETDAQRAEQVNRAKTYRKPVSP